MIMRAAILVRETGDKISAPMLFVGPHFFLEAESIPGPSCDRKDYVAVVQCLPCTP